MVNLALNRARTSEQSGRGWQGDNERPPVSWPVATDIRPTEQTRLNVDTTGESSTRLTSDLTTGSRFFILIRTARSDFDPYFILSNKNQLPTAKMLAALWSGRWNGRCTMGPGGHTRTGTTAHCMLARRVAGSATSRVQHARRTYIYLEA